MYASAEALEEAYYAAFEAADIDAMLGLWTRAADGVCVHPEGRILTGPDAIGASWRMLFRDGPGLHFKRRTITRAATADLVVHTLVETVSVAGESRPRGSVLATNVYRRTDAGWEMLMHHASPQPQEPAPQPPPPGRAVH